MSYLKITSLAATYLRACPGAGVLGVVDCGGLGIPLSEAEVDVCQLWAGRKGHNAKLLNGLRTSEHSDWLLDNIQDEVRKGRMAPARLVDGPVCEEWLLSPCFVVEQPKSDGSTKLRSIDHLSWSPEGSGREGSVNAYTAPTAKLKQQTADVLVHANKEIHEESQEPPGLIKVCEYIAACPFLYVC